MGLGISEIVIILLAVTILLFGGKKVVELARGLGRASGEYKKAKTEVENEIKETYTPVTTDHSEESK